MENNNPIKFIWKSSKRYFGLIILLAVLSGMLSGSFILLALFSKYILDTAAEASFENGFWHTEEIAVIFWYAVRIGAVILIQALLNVLISNIQVHAVGKIEIRIKDEIFESLLKKKYENISEIHSGEILNRFTSDVSVVASSLVAIIPYAVSLGVRLLGGLLVLAYIDSRFTAAICIIGVVIFVFGKILSPVFKGLHKRVQETDGFVRSFVQECIENIVVIKSFSKSSRMLERLDVLQNDNYKMKVKRNVFSNIANTGVYVIFTASYYAALLWGAFGIIHNTVTFGSLIAFLQVIEQVRAPMKNISGILPQYYQMLASAERITEFLKMPEEECGKMYTPKLYDISSELVIDNITFAYKDENVLESACAAFKKGEITAICGQSGIGKSTVMKLMLALMKPAEGDIYFRTQNENVSVSKGTRSLFSYVPQGNMLLSGTIRENIAFCCENSSDEEIKEAARLACAWEFIEKLPKGLESRIGERGVGLSEGQIQRIALARAFLTDSPVILLDEATGALDFETEARVVENLKHMKNKMCIFISHKRSTVLKCDKVYKIENKKLIKTQLIDVFEKNT